MRHRYLITITDYRGARHYTLTQLMKRMLAGVLCAVGLVFLTGTLLLHGLNSRVNELNGELASLETRQAEIMASNDALLADRQALQREVDEKADSLMALSSELESIEILIGLRAEPERPLAQRIDTASQTAFEKRLMLESIPSGFPVESEVVTSRFGMRRHPIRDELAMHGGADLRATTGTPIYATADGVVEWASFHHNSGLGKMVKLVHNYGFSTIYGHMDEIEVQVGTYIKRGELIGYSGNTGASAAPHLHYEVRHLNRRLDPLPFLNWSINDYDRVFTEEDRVEWESLVEVIRRTASVAAERPSSLQAQNWSATSP
ncbi:M23 family metallopeptidase [Wenzhouxiangella marina]|uniref:Peptidase M23B n=1 Tax=Wenzhouxiangella marina TaxID=1579979 RepID=A0A0K0XWE7_9GAMM|nr:M23 family metallopeptidase [Wenzhouxiangella marina]AKS41995.1 Peptidase M23B [Wenzhouxiangella marina]MBB6086238.1 murein DD-endopeptidase MepM/ murein hydrolase activator NlpD [Wenzhouxiangella marina]